MDFDEALDNLEPPELPEQFDLAQEAFGLDPLPPDLLDILDALRAELPEEFHTQFDAFYEAATVKGFLRE